MPLVTYSRDRRNGAFPDGRATDTAAREQSGVRPTLFAR